MRLALLILGTLFAAGTVVLIGYLIDGDLNPYLRDFRGPYVAAACFIGLPAVVSVFFFRWARNVGQGGAGR